MDKLINELKREIEHLERDRLYSANQVSVDALDDAIKFRESQIRNLKIEAQNIITLTCKEEDESAFESAFEMLGFTVLDSSWDDENNRMYYKIKQ